MLDEGTQEWGEEVQSESARSDAGAPGSDRPEMRLRERPNRPVEGPQAPAAKDEGETRRFRRRRVRIALGLLCALVVAAAGYLYWDNARRFETTDDVHRGAPIRHRSQGVGLPHGSPRHRQ